MYKLIAKHQSQIIGLFVTPISNKAFLPKITLFAYIVGQPYKPIQLVLFHILNTIQVFIIFHKKSPTKIRNKKGKRKMASKNNRFIAESGLYDCQMGKCTW